MLAADEGPFPKGQSAAVTATVSVAGPTDCMLVGLEPDVTTMAYDALGERTSLTGPAPAGQSGTETATSIYDAAGRLTSVTAPPASGDASAASQVTT